MQEYAREEGESKKKEGSCIGAMRGHHRAQIHHLVKMAQTENIHVKELAKSKRARKNKLLFFLTQGWQCSQLDHQLYWSKMFLSSEKALGSAQVL